MGYRFAPLTSVGGRDSKKSLWMLASSASFDSHSVLDRLFLGGGLFYGLI